MTNISFLGLTNSSFGSQRPAETAGTIAYSKPQVFRPAPAETAGSIASSSSSSTGSTSCSGSTIAVA